MFFLPGFIKRSYKAFFLKKKILEHCFAILLLHLKTFTPTYDAIEVFSKAYLLLINIYCSKVSGQIE
jgi:hypothetical protein